MSRPNPNPNPNFNSTNPNPNPLLIQPTETAGATDGEAAALVELTRSMPNTLSMMLTVMADTHLVRTDEGVHHAVHGAVGATAVLRGLDLTLAQERPEPPPADSHKKGGDDQAASKNDSVDVESQQRHMKRGELYHFFKAITMQLHTAAQRIADINTNVPAMHHQQHSRPLAHRPRITQESPTSHRVKEEKPLNVPRSAGGKVNGEKQPMSKSPTAKRWKRGICLQELPLGVVGTSSSTAGRQPGPEDPIWRHPSLAEERLTVGAGGDPKDARRDTDPYPNTTS